MPDEENEEDESLPNTQALDDTADTTGAKSPARPDPDDMVQDLRQQIIEEDEIIPEGFIELVVEGEAEATRIQLDSQLILGRFSERLRDVAGHVDLTFYFEYGISRRHAVIRRLPNGLVLVDLDSSNGTKLNGELLEPNRPYPLRSGDSITLGDLKMRIYLPS